MVYIAAIRSPLASKSGHQGKEGKIFSREKQSKKETGQEGWLSNHDKVFFFIQVNFQGSGVSKHRAAFVELSPSVKYIIYLIPNWL